MTPELWIAECNARELHRLRTLAEQAAYMLGEALKRADRAHAVDDIPSARAELGGICQTFTRAALALIELA